MSVYSIIILALISSIVIIMVKQYKPEFAMLTAIAAGCTILAVILLKFTPILEQLRTISEKSGIKNEYLQIMLKSLGICYLTQFSSDVCNDFGQTSMASKIEFCGRIMIAALSIPLLVSLIETVTDMVT